MIDPVFQGADGKLRIARRRVTGVAVRAPGLRIRHCILRSAQSYVIPVAPASQFSHGVESLEGTSAADVDHGAGGLEEAGFADVVAGFFSVYSSGDESAEF